MFKKFIIISMILLSPLSVSNGHYQTTKIEFEGIEETCYGTLLSEKSISGSWSYQLVIDLNAPEEVKKAFSEYADADYYFYLNYFQDVSEGLLFWPVYPPERFKVLLYFPGSDTFVVSDIIDRYALTSTYKAEVKDGTISLKRNYDYTRITLMTISRFIIIAAAAIIMTMLRGKPNRIDYKYVFSANIIYHLLLNICISIYSFRYGFSMVEYIGVLWLPYLLVFFIQSFIYKQKAKTIYSPYFASFFGNISAYAVGLFLVDVFPALYTVVW